MARNVITGPGVWKGVGVAQEIFAAQGMSVEPEREAGKYT